MIPPFLPYILSDLLWIIEPLLSTFLKTTLLYILSSVLTFHLITPNIPSTQLTTPLTHQTPATFLQTTNSPTLLPNSSNRPPRYPPVTRNDRPLPFPPLISEWPLPAHPTDPACPFQTRTRNRPVPSHPPPPNDPKPTGPLSLTSSK